MELPVVTQYRPDGTIEYRLEAQDASHYQRDALTRLSGPHLTLFRHQGAPWIASAAEGVLRRPPAGADEESVSLHRDVTLEQTRPDGEQIRMVTQLLHLYPRRQYAETEQDVMIESLFGRTTSVGLEGDLQLGVLKFFSTDDRPVRTVLQPEQFK
jgi:lipopolysaccharide export system protein LptC